MPLFIIQSERKTWTKWLVEANNEVAAAQSSDRSEYLGVMLTEKTPTQKL